MRDRAWAYLEGLVSESVRPAPTTGSIVDRVVVEKDPRGGVIVSVPLGTRVVVVQRPE